VSPSTAHSPINGESGELIGSQLTNPIIMAHTAMHMNNTLVFILVFLFSVQSYTNILKLPNSLVTLPQNTVGNSI
jgi:hypothetical protein